MIINNLLTVTSRYFERFVVDFQGCVQAGKDFIKDHIGPVAGVGVGIAFVQVGCLLLIGLNEATFDFSF